MSIVDDFVSALEHAKDLSIEETLGLLLAKMRRHTVAEAGSVFIVRPVDDKPEELKACSFQNDKISNDGESFTIAIDKTSIAGYVASTGEILEIEDLYDIPIDSPYRFNRSFDDKVGYRSQSMVAFPLKNYQGRIIGVVQLLNHIEASDENGNVYGPFPLDYVDDMKGIMVILGAMVEREDLVREMSELKTKIAELEAAK